MKTDLAAQFQTPGLSAYEVARLTYQAANPQAEKTFEEELEEHLKTSFVMVLPSEFLVARAAELPGDGRIAWLVTHAIGHLAFLMAALPYRLEWIAFHRGHGDRRLRVYRFERLFQLALARRAAAKREVTNQESTKTGNSGEVPARNWIEYQPTFATGKVQCPICGRLIGSQRMARGAHAAWHMKNMRQLVSCVPAFLIYQLFLS